MTETIKAWHFVGNTLRDGRPVPKDGVWLRHDGQIRICARGLHASRRPWHALQYALGATLCYVECRGDVQEETDKLVCRERRIIMRADVTETLLYFARMQALSVIHLWTSEPPDVVLGYLMTGDESLRNAAWDAASAAASSAARDAGSSAASSAAWDAASAATSASWDAASSTATTIAIAAASAATSAAARDAASAASWAIAWDAATTASWAAAWDAAWDAASADFDALIREQFGVAT